MASPCLYLVALCSHAQSVASLCDAVHPCPGRRTMRQSSSCCTTSSWSAKSAPPVGEALLAAAAAAVVELILWHFAVSTC